MKRNHYLHKIAMNDNCQKKKKKKEKRNEAKKSTQGHNIESAITIHLSKC